MFRTDYNSLYISYTSLTYFIDKFYHVLFLSVNDHTVSASLLCEIKFFIRLPGSLTVEYQEKYLQVL